MSHGLHRARFDASLRSADSRGLSREGHAHGKKHGYDVISHPRVGTLTGFYYRGGDITVLTPSHLVSDVVSFFDLFSVLADREFYFVLRGNEISGTRDSGQGHWGNMPVFLYSDPQVII